MTAEKTHVRSMFSRIAPIYDLLNRLMTFGQDIRWRRILVREIPIPGSAVVLDIGCGTGDLAREVRLQHPDSRVIAADFTPEMVQLGSLNTKDPQVEWVIADAQHLPFADQAFHVVVCGYLLRNVPDVDHALIEQARVTRPGGWGASLDTTPPESGWLAPIINFYLNKVVPALGRLIGGDASAYRYLSESTQDFLDAEQVRIRYLRAGFQEVVFRKLMLRTMAIHWGKIPQLNSK